MEKVNLPGSLDYSDWQPSTRTCVVVGVTAAAALAVLAGLSGCDINGAAWVPNSNSEKGRTGGVPGVQQSSHDELMDVFTAAPLVGEEEVIGSGSGAWEIYPDGDVVEGR